MEFQLGWHCHPRKIEYPPTIPAVPPRGRGCAGQANDGGLGGMRDELSVTVLDGGGFKPKTGQFNKGLKAYGYPRVEISILITLAQVSITDIAEDPV